MKAKLALLKAGSSSTQTAKPFQTKNKGLVAKTFDWHKEEVSYDEEMVQVKVLMARADDELVVDKNHARNGEWIDITMKKLNILLLMDEDLTEASSKNDVNENAFIPASMGYDHEMILKSKDWVERYNPDSKLPNFNTRRILVSENQAVTESLRLTEAPNNPDSSKESGSEPRTPLALLKFLQGASPSSDVMLIPI
ncbi:hypothetical protein Tco_1294018 [Tanacetum coccineum]